MVGSGSVSHRTGRTQDDSDIVMDFLVVSKGVRREQCAARTREWQGYSVALLELGARTASMCVGACDGAIPSTRTVISAGRIPLGGAV